MSSSEQQIRCRKCRENIPVEAGKCPHCGTSIRSTFTYVAIIVIGVVLVLASLINPGTLLFFGLVGALLAGVGVLVLYDKRQRLVAG